jgi:tRNA(fMet)-specific endonuclease VapC
VDYLLDTNIIIQMLRGNVDLTNLVNSYDTVIDSTVYIEALQGSKSNTEKLKVKKLIDSFSLIHFTPDVSKATIKLIDTYSTSHNLMLPDAQIASCCLVYNLQLLTYNFKDFRFIKGLKVFTPPFPQT